jgi:hypothetical protein
LKRGGVDDLLPSKCKWTDIAKELDNGRNGKRKCRDRWQTTFDRESRREWTRDEEELIKDMHLFRPK